MTEILHSERELSQGSTTVLRTAASLTPLLLEEHPEIADLYRDTSLTKAEIAKLVAPDLAEIFPSATRAAVGNVLSELIPAEERKLIASRRQSDVLSRRIANMEDEDFKAHQREAARQRHLKVGVNSEVMTRGKGITPWTEQERMFAIFLSTQPDYQHPNGNNKGKVIQNKVAEALNVTFHNSEPKRDRDSIRGFLNGWRKKNRESSTQKVEQEQQTQLNPNG